MEWRDAVQQMAVVKRLWNMVRLPLNARSQGYKRQQQQQQQPAYRRWIDGYQRHRKRSDSQFYDARPCYWSLVSCYWLK